MPWRKRKQNRDGRAGVGVGQSGQEAGLLFFFFNRDTQGRSHPEGRILTHTCQNLKL